MLGLPSSGCAVGGRGASFVTGNTGRCVAGLRFRAAVARPAPPSAAKGLPSVIAFDPQHVGDSQSGIGLARSEQIRGEGDQVAALLSGGKIRPRATFQIHLEAARAPIIPGWNDRNSL